VNTKKVHELSERLKELKESRKDVEGIIEMGSEESYSLNTALTALDNNILTTTKELYKERGLDYSPTPVEDGNTVMYLLLRKGGLEPVVAKLDPSVASDIKRTKIKLYASYSGRSWHLAGKHPDGSKLRVARLAAGIPYRDRIVIHKNGDVFDCRRENLEVSTRSDAARKRIEDQRAGEDNGIQKIGEKYRVNVYVPAKGHAVYGGLFDDLEEAREARDVVLNNEKDQGRDAPRED